MNKSFFLKVVLGLSVLFMISCADGNSDVTSEVVSDAYIYQTVDEDGEVVSMVNAYSYSNVPLTSTTLVNPHGSEWTMEPYMSSNYTYTIAEENKILDELLTAFGTYQFTTMLESGELFQTSNIIVGSVVANLFEINEVSIDATSVSLDFSESVDAGAYIIIFEDEEGTIVYSSGYALPTLSDDTFIGTDLTIEEDASGWYSAGPSSVKTVKVMSIRFEDEDSPSEFALQAILEVEHSVSVE